MTLYLVLEKKGKKWIPRGGRLFASDDEVWDWVDAHYREDSDRLRLYCVDINLSGYPIFDADHNVIETIP